MRWTRGVLAGMAIAATAASAGAAQEETFEWREAMRAGESLRVRGIIGEIRAEYTSGDEAEVVARKDGRSRDFDQVEIRVDRRGQEVVVCAVYRPDRVRGEGCTYESDRDGERGDRRSIDVEVDFLVRLPAGVAFNGMIVSGDVRAEDLRSDVEISTVDGDIHVSTSGKARGRTVSGSIEIAMGCTEWRDLEFGTVSGDITLWLPEGIETDLDFQSLTGDIRSDFDITRTRDRSGRWLGENVEGYIGDSGRRSLSFHTVSGDVRLRRSRS